MLLALKSPFQLKSWESLGSHCMTLLSLSLWIYWKGYSDKNGTTSVWDSDIIGTKSLEKNSTTGGATAVQWWMQLVLFA